MRAVRNGLPRFSLSGITKNEMTYFYSNTVVTLISLTQNLKTGNQFPQDDRAREITLSSYRARSYRARPRQDKLWKSQNFKTQGQN